MKRHLVRILTILLPVVLPAFALAQDIRVGTFFDHTGALKDWGPRHQMAADLAARQMADAGFTMALIHKDSKTDADAERHTDGRCFKGRKPFRSICLRAHRHRHPGRWTYHPSTPSLTRCPLGAMAW